MSRTYRRRGQRHDYDRVLRDYHWVNGALTRFRIDARSKEGRRAPRWYRRIFNHRRRTLNVRQLRRWLNDPGLRRCVRRTSPQRKLELVVTARHDDVLLHRSASWMATVTERTVRRHR